jgi:toxin-antitoxin system PIN domain toxin
VIVLDANILLYAYGAASPHHEKARVWLAQAFSGDETVGLPWLSLTAFFRIVTNPRIPGFRRSVGEASRVIDEWLEQTNTRVLVPGDQHWPIFRQMIGEGQATGPLVTDAQLAALTMEYGGVLYTTDRDFAKFPGLRWVNPLA